MRLYVATGIFHPESGGPATYLHGLLPEIQRAGHEVRLLTFGQPTLDDSHYGYPVRRIPRRSRILRPLAYASYACNIRRDVGWADILYINSLGLPIPGEARIPRAIKIVGDLAWERAIRLGLIPPTEDIDLFQSKRYSPVVEWLKRQRTRNARQTDQIIVPSHYLKEMVAGWGIPEERIAVIYNALSPTAVRQRTNLSQGEARALLRLPDAPLLLTVARLTAWKGIEPLIKAVAQIPGIHLYVAGDGPLQRHLEGVIAQLALEERVHLLGRVARQDVATFMAAADYTVLYSGYEGLSHTLLESLHAGTPVIASDKCGNPEVVLPDLNGFLVPYNDEEALADCLQQAFRPGVHEALQRTCSQQLERFSWDRMVARTTTLLESLTLQHANGST